MESTAQIETGADRLLAAAGSTPLVGVVVALLTWPILSLLPASGPDGSWQAGLYLAAREGIHFGTRFVFTYGPLGFLQVPALYDTTLWFFAFLHESVIWISLAIALLWATRRSMPLLPAAVVVFALLVVGYLEAAPVLLALVVCLAALSDRPPAHAVGLVSVGGGILGAIEVSGKLNFGIAIVLLCLIALLGSPGRRRSLPVLLVVLLGSLLVIWVVTGQSLSAVPDYLSHSSEVLSGYSSAMAFDVTEVGWQRPWAVAAIGWLLLAAAIASRRDPWPAQAATVLLVAAFSFFMFKQSFVRQGLGNAQDFFPLVLGAGLALAWRLPVRLWRLPPRLPVALLLVPLAGLTIAALPGRSLWESLDPHDHVEYLRQDLRALVSGAQRHRLEEEARSRLVANYDIDQRTLSLLHGRRVAIEPWEITAAWAYKLDWEPLPVIQGYQAYTPSLDALNSKALTERGRPTAILRQNTHISSGIDSSIDDRNPAWDPPDQVRTMLCNYRAVRTTATWQVLYPTADRCGPPRVVGRVRSKTGKRILVPAPPRHGIVFARIRGLGVEGLEELRTSLYRARERWVTVNGRRRWHLVPETAGDGLIMRSDPAVDFPAPFRLAPQARTLSFELTGSSRQIAVTFYAQRVGRMRAERMPARSPAR